MRYFIVSWLIFLSLLSNAQVIEKSYLTTDKDIYAPSDTVWFKGYVFNTDNTLSISSIAYHVLMVDAAGNKLLDTSWPINGGITDGYFVAPMLEGRFRLMAVSGQMIGSPPDQIFSKDLFVRSEIADEIQLLAFPRFEKFVPNDQNLVDIFTRFSANNSAPEVKLTYRIINGDKTSRKRRIETSAEGKVVLNLKDIDPQASDLTLLIESEDKRLTKPIKLAVPIPVKEQNIDLQFFPEGGNLVNGLENKVAFKAIDQNGKPFDFRGKVLNQHGEEIANIQSLFAGMGEFSFVPESSQRYIVELLDSTYTLPHGVDSGVSLSIADVVNNDSSSKYAVIKASPDLYNQNSKLVLYRNERQVGILNFKLSERSLWKIPFDNMNVGIYRITILNENDIPLAERLLFSNPDKGLTVSIETDKEAYQSREKVTANLKVTDHLGLPIQANLSLSAIDDARSKSPLSEQPNLLAQVLLASELRGNIPKPNFYFSNDPKSLPALDLVLMTNGWRKYKPSELKEPEGISGSLHKMNSKKRLLTDREVVITSLRNGGIDYFDVDTSGIFRIPATYLKDKGDSFLIFSEKTSKKDKFSLRPDQKKRIEKSIGLKNYLSYHSDSKLLTDNLIFRKEHKLQPDRFQNTLLLNSVVVEGNKILPNTGCELRDYHFQEPWVTKRVEELDMTDINLLYLLKQVSPIVKQFGNFKPLNRLQPMVYDALLSNEIPAAPDGAPMRIQINCEPMEVIEFTQMRGFETVDGQYFAQEVLNRIDWSNIESISINSTFRSAETGANGTDIVFADWTFPLVNINTINDQLIYKPIFDMKYFHSTYQNYTKEFYAPVYETEKQRNDPVPDLRTTIFWQANVFTDENGEATITYYNADRPNEIKLTVEGVDGYSRLGFGTSTYKVLEGPQTEDNR
ncbi:hypothetical protein [Roseivirga sp.]|uniref:hypothetical protein n=1 Tax=Roseivirga sp. TaxID=1964215 RepID=UPI003B8CF83D